MPTLFKDLPTRLSFVLWLGNLSFSLPLGFHFVRVASYQAASDPVPTAPWNASLHFGPQQFIRVARHTPWTKKHWSVLLPCPLFLHHVASRLTLMDKLYSPSTAPLSWYNLGVLPEGPFIKNDNIADDMYCTQRTLKTLPKNYCNW